MAHNNKSMKTEQVSLSKMIELIDHDCRFHKKMSKDQSPINPKGFNDRFAKDAKVYGSVLKLLKGLRSNLTKIN